MICSHAKVGIDSSEAIMPVGAARHSSVGIFAPASTRMSTPNFSSPRADFRALSRAGAARMNELPPPGTTPSEMAARVAWSASSTRLFFSLSSASSAWALFEL